MELQLVTPYHVSHLECYGIIICGNITSVDPPLAFSHISVFGVIHLGCFAS